MALGLKEYRERKAAEEKRREEGNKPKVTRFNLLKDGDSAIIRFGQEMDPDAKGYDPKVGIGVVHLYHQNGDDPKNGFFNQALCSLESQGDCYPHNRMRGVSRDEWDGVKGWKVKEKFCINVIGGDVKEVVVNENGKDKTKYVTTDLPDDAKGGTVYLLEQSTFNGIYEQLSNWFLNTKASKETIVGKTFQITRSGNDFNNTKYSIIPVEDLPKGATPLSEFELYDIANVLPDVPFAQQDAFYHQGQASAPAAAPADAPASSATGTTDGW